MNHQNIEQIIRDLFKDNHRAYPYHYDGIAASAIDKATETATAFWDTRNADEEQRDTQAGVTKGDYINWCLSELKEQQKVNN